MDQFLLLFHLFSLKINSSKTFTLISKLTENQIHIFYKKLLFFHFDNFLIYYSELYSKDYLTIIY